MNEQNFKIEEKEIKELAKTIVEFKETNGLPIGKDWHSVDLSEYLIKAGYRKADEVKKETAKKIYNEIAKKRGLIEMIGKYLMRYLRNTA